MPGYVDKLLQRFEHEKKKNQHCPYPAQPRKFGAASQEPLKEDTTLTVDEPRKKSTTNCRRIIILRKGSR